jgi:hypothetical protein
LINFKNIFNFVTAERRLAAIRFTEGLSCAGAVLLSLPLKCFAPQRA